METREIVWEMRAFSEGRRFVWACAEGRATMTVEISTDTDPCELGLQLVAFDRSAGYGVEIHYWDGKELTAFADVEEAAMVLERIIADMRWEARSARLSRIPSNTNGFSERRAVAS